MGNTKRQAFYKSRRWENFVQGLRAERATADGLVICEHCGKPIIKSYDCIGHHIEELTEENVDNALISLNPENVQLVHFRCHNEIHKRFGYAERRVQRVYIVYGAPCSGKSAFVNDVAEPGDIVLDIERLWTAVKAGKCGKNIKPTEIKGNVFALRDCLLDQIRTRRGRWNNAYIIGGYPLQGERERLAADVGADKLVFIDTPKEVCLQRASNIGTDQFKFALDWFEKFSTFQQDFQQDTPPGSF